MWKRLRNKPWFNGAVVACIAVVLYIFLLRFSIIRDAIRTFINFFSPVILGAVIAYTVSPLATLFKRRVFARIKSEKIKNALSDILAYVLILTVLVLLLVLLVPQLISSLRMFVANMPVYEQHINTLLTKLGVISTRVDLSEFIERYEKLLDYVVTYVSSNTNKLLRMSATIGKVVLLWIMALILSVYFMIEKRRIKRGFHRLMRATFSEEKYRKVAECIKRGDKILNRYISYNILDSLIIGGVNALFMLMAHMPYAGLISFIVGVTNLVPNFGPIVGGVIGAFILFLAKPRWALYFIIFSILLQAVDGYIIKPKLFGDKFGVSAMWILIGVIVGGRMFGVGGMLLAIPVVAILDFLYRDYFLPWLETRRKRFDSEDGEQPKKRMPQEPPAKKTEQ